MSTGLIDGRLVNRADLASLCSVSLPTVDAWVEKGCPYVERGSKGREWKFDSAAVIDWRIQRAVENAVSGYEDESGKISREEADRRKAVANAITAEIGADDDDDEDERAAPAPTRRGAPARRALTVAEVRKAARRRSASIGSVGPKSARSPSSSASPSSASGTPPVKRPSPSSRT